MLLPASITTLFSSARAVADQAERTLQETDAAGVVDLLSEHEQEGNGQGGGIASVLSATSTVSGSTLIQNEAAGEYGGAGVGGGAFNDATSSLPLANSVVTMNRADGTPGIGGGIFTLGTFSSILPLIEDNHASTSGNDVRP